MDRTIAALGPVGKRCQLVLVAGVKQGIIGMQLLPLVIEEFIGVLENIFWCLGGITKTLVIDNLRAGVGRPGWFDPELNPKLMSFCRHYGAVILPTSLGAKRRSTLMTSNRPLVDWVKLIGDASSATGILERFLRHAEVLTFNGTNFRLRD